MTELVMGAFMNIERKRKKKMHINEREEKNGCSPRREDATMRSLQVTMDRTFPSSSALGQRVDYLQA